MCVYTTAFPPIHPTSHSPSHFWHYPKQKKKLKQKFKLSQTNPRRRNALSKPSHRSTTMHLLKTALLTATWLLSLASAGCFKSGEIWHDKASAARQVSIVCDEIIGVYGIRDTRTRCRNQPGDFNFQFTVRKFTSGKTKLTKANCVNKLSREINGCDRGGKSSYVDFEFT